MPARHTPLQRNARRFWRRRIVRAPEWLILALYPRTDLIKDANVPDLGYLMKNRRDHSGYFSDPDGHLWEIIYNRAMPVRDERVKPTAKTVRRIRARR